MMKQGKGILLFSLFISVLVFLTPGCGKKEEESKKEKKVTLRFMYREDITGIRQFEELFAKFKEKFPHIKIDAQNVPFDQYISKILTVAASGDLPDVFYSGCEEFPYYSMKGMIQPLDSFFKEDSELKLSNFHSNVVKNMSYQGKVWCLPKGCNTHGIFYNKDLFDEAGVKYPDESWTWDTLLEAARKLTKDKNNDGRIDQYGIVINNWHPAYMGFPWSSGGDITTPDGRKMTIDDPKFIEGMKFVGDLSTKYKVSPSLEMTQQHGDYQLFMTGRVAIIVMGGYISGDFRKIKTFDWDAAPIPKCPRTNKRVTGVWFVGWVMSSTTKHPKEAWEFMKLMAGPVGTRRFCREGRDMPAINDEEALKLYLDPTKKPKNMKVFVDALEYARGLPMNGIYFPIIKEDLKQLMDKIRHGLGSTEEVLKQDSVKLQKKLDEFWKDLDKK